MNLPQKPLSAAPWAAGLCALILVVSPQAGYGASPVPGGRFFAGLDFATRSATEQHFCHKAVESAAQAIAPALASAESIVIYSLDPTHLDDFRPGVTDRKHFHSFPILGRATWRSADLDTLRRTVIEGLIPSERVLCFAPRHGIRIITPKATVDLVLCFECHKMRVYGVRPDSQTDDCFFDAEVLNLLNAFLDAHRIARNIPASPGDQR